MGWRDAPVVGQQPAARAAWEDAPVVGQQPPRPARVPVRPRQVTETAAAAPTQYQEGPTPTRRETPRTIREGAERAGEVAVGAGEVGLSTATGGVAEVIAGLGGLAELVQGGDDAAERAAQRVGEIQELRTYQPRTETGQAMLEATQVPFQRLQELAGRAGGATLDATGSPLAATAVDTALQAAPMAAGVRGRPRTLPEGTRRGDRERITRMEREQGVNLGAGVIDQRRQIAEAGGRLAGSERGGAMPDIQQALRTAREQARGVRDQMYQSARDARAGVATAEVRQLPDIMREATRDFLLEDMPRAQRLVSRLDRVRDLPQGSVVQLRALDDWRRSLNRNRPARSDQAQNAAIDVMKGELDNWMDSMFNADMIRGDPAAVRKWRDARRAHQDYRARFNDNRVIRDLSEQQATPEQARQWIFGASATGAKKEAAEVVRRIKSEVGEDSPQFAALRADAALDVMEPLLQPEPNLRQFVRNHERMVRQNPSMARELFGENLRGMNDLRDLARAHMNRPVAALSELPGGSRVASVALFGHQLARKALLVRSGTAAAGALSRLAEKGPRRRMMADILGYDPNAPLFRGVTPAVGAATQELANPSVDEQQDRRGPGGGFELPRSAP